VASSWRLERGQRCPLGSVCSAWRVWLEDSEGVGDGGIGLLEGLCPAVFGGKRGGDQVFTDEVRFDWCNITGVVVVIGCVV